VAAAPVSAPNKWKNRAGDRTLNKESRVCLPCPLGVSPEETQLIFLKLHPSDALKKVEKR
jgi:hypothetical protein